MKLINHIYLAIRSIMPDYWIQLKPYNKEYDDSLNRMMDLNIPVMADRNSFGEISIFYAHLGDMKIWIENYPYAYCEFKGMRPSRRTIARFKKYSEWWLANPPVERKDNVVNIR